MTLLTTIALAILCYLLASAMLGAALLVVFVPGLALEWLRGYAARVNAGERRR